MKGALFLQLRIIAALMMREIRTRYGHSRLGYAWAVIEPAVQIGLLCTIFLFIGRHPPLGSSFIVFFFTGYMPFFLFRQLADRAGAAITSNRALLSFPPVKNMDTVWARLALELATVVFLLMFLTAAIEGIGIPALPANMLGYIGGYFAAFVLGTGVGILNAVLSPIFHLWSQLFSIFMRMQYFVSGVFFIPDFMPPSFQAVVVFNPVAHCIMWVREGFYGGYQASLLDRLYPLAIGAVAAILGLTIERLFRRQVDAR